MEMESARVEIPTSNCLLLIVDNIALKLPSKPQIYDTVLPCWINAMKTMNSVVSGVAQRIQNPEVVLGLCSWHLYPDMYVILEKEEYVEQKDELVPREAPITFGLQDSCRNDGEGISWSLPLSRLRYYGRPVVRERMLSTSKMRVSFGSSHPPTEL